MRSDPRITFDRVNSPSKPSFKIWGEEILQESNHVLNFCFLALSHSVSLSLSPYQTLSHSLSRFLDLKCGYRIWENSSKNNWIHSAATKNCNLGDSPISCASWKMSETLEAEMKKKTLKIFSQNLPCYRRRSLEKGGPPPRRPFSNRPHHRLHTFAKQFLLHHDSPTTKSFPKLHQMGWSI